MSATMSGSRPWPFYGPPPFTVPRVLRIVATATSFATWGICALLLGLVVFPAFYLWPGGARRRRERFTRLLALSCRGFAALLLRAQGILDYVAPGPPPDVAPGAPFVLVANHPTLVDVVILLGAVPKLVSVVRAGLYRNPFMRALLATSLYIPGPGYAGDEASDADLPVVERMVEALRGGSSVLVFPEGTRSLPTTLHKFHRGAVEAAARAGVPVACLFIGVDPPLLMKGQPWWTVAAPKPSRYTIEWLPTVDVAGKDPRETHLEIERTFRARFERYAADVGRVRAIPSDTR